MSKGTLVAEPSKDVGGINDEIGISPSSEKKEGAIGIFSRFLRLNALGTKRNGYPDTPTSTEPPTTYYGVYIPCEIKKGSDEEALHVYKNRTEALDLVRKYKSARFKVFQSHQDAVQFALRGAEPMDVVDGNDNSLLGEKPYPFKAPSPQDMVALRKAIEAGLTTTVQDRVWDNPRYLVSSGNTPSILQEGSRYNALHVAAKAMNAEICNLILTTVGNPAFVQLLYGMDADAQCCKEFAAILVDRYLNTPDKAMNETPLHFASKFGAQEVIDVLTSFPQCNKNAVNKFGEQAKDIIGKRSSTSTPESIRNMAQMLNERYYVPVLHSEDDSVVPTIGQPFTLGESLTLNKDPMSPRFEIRAYAGPMEAADAQCFRRRWKTPPRSLRPARFRLKEISKGLESVGRNLAEQLKVGWKEYWPFLDTFTDLKSTEGLALLEKYLKNKYENACSTFYNDSCMNHLNDELSISKISLGNLSTNSPMKDLSMSPMSDLCYAMKGCTISSDRQSHWRNPLRQKISRQPITIKAHTPENGDALPVNHTVSQILCIERTCQVFAKRIADVLVFSLTAEPEVAGDSLKSESKHLQHTMFTYMDDERFRSIDFSLIHSRLAQLIVFKLRQMNIDLIDLNSLLEFLVKLKCPNDDIFSSDDDRKPTYRSPIVSKSNIKYLKQILDCHVRCLAGFISDELTESNNIQGPSVTDSECKGVWESASKCFCDWKVDYPERNSKRNASFRKNRTMLSSSPKSDSFLKRLIFDQDMGDGGRLSSSEDVKVKPSNSPAGDFVPTLFTVDMDKCQIISELVSDDESDKSSASDDYHTASENKDDDDDHDEMLDASDQTAVEPFIYGEEPTKMDRLVFDAITDCEISREQYPYLCRWRHTVALYSPTERDKWRQADEETMESPSSYSIKIEPFPASPHRTRARGASNRCSTPKKLDTSLSDNVTKNIPLQVSNWLRVTGPNSPRSALAAKNVTQNVSFGF